MVGNDVGMGCAVYVDFDAGTTRWICRPAKKTRLRDVGCRMCKGGTPLKRRCGLLARVLARLRAIRRASEGQMVLSRDSLAEEFCLTCQLGEPCGCHVSFIEELVE